MDFMKIYKLTQTDFDGIINAAGGEKFCKDDSRETQPNPDYLLDEAVIELKFVEEEGLEKRKEKKKRQQKIADIFKKHFPDKPVIVLDPNLLQKNEQRNYYQALSTPIQDQVKKAASQLKQAAVNYPDKVRVAVLINIGYGSLYHEEFKEIAIKRATNDTQQIDSLVVGGIYFYSDGFDHYEFEPFDEIPINLNKRFVSFDKLKKQWKVFMENFMTSVITNNREIQPDRLPVLEIDFEVDNIKFIKPAPPMGAPSKFWTKGRPRKNSSAIKEIPPVFMIFPKLNKENWERFTEGERYDAKFQETYEDWLKFSAETTQADEKELQPFISMEVNYDGFCAKYKPDEVICFHHLCEYATEVFHEEIHKIANSAINQDDLHLILPEYILLVVEEIGQNKENDLSSIYHVRQLNERDMVTAILENRKLPYEYSLYLASSYAIKCGVSQVIFRRDQKYMWQ